MVRGLLVRGLLAGLLAGGLAFTLAHAVGEPQINRAIAFENYVDATVHHELPGHATVSRATQSTIGLAVGSLVTGAALGGIFALVFAVAYGRIGTRTARGTAAVIGVLGFVAVFLTPFLKYPANPPAVGDPDTIGHRTTLYLVLLAVAVVAMVGAVLWRRQLTARLGAWNATIAAGAAYIATVIVAYVVFPGVNEVPQEGLPGVVRAVTDAGVTFPPVVLSRFRMASIGVQAVLWAVIAIAFGALAERAVDGATRAGTLSDVR